MQQLSRREALHTFFWGAAAIQTATGAPAGALFRLAPQSHLRTGLLRVDLAEFPELAESSGSVRLGTSPMKSCDSGALKQTGLFPPIVINRLADGRLVALSADCPHEGCSVEKLSRTSGQIRCLAHGSRFSAEGDYLEGPAGRSLDRYPLREMPGGILEVDLPQDSFFEISVARAPAGQRVSITFLGFDKIVYQIFFRPALHRPADLVPFSLSAEGLLNQTEVRIADNYVTLFVEKPGPQGFFQVVMKSSKV